MCVDVRRGLVCLVASLVLLVLAVPAQAEFGAEAFDGQVTADAAGHPFTQAGGHPFAASTTVTFNTFTHPVFGPGWPVAPTKDLFVDLPPGFVGNPTIGEKCSLPDLALAPPTCPVASQVGIATVRWSPGSAGDTIGPIGVYLMVPPPDVPARFGFNVSGTVVMLDADLRSGSDYGLSVDAKDISEGLAVNGTSLTLWGVPADTSHDSQRACPGLPFPSNTCGSQAALKPFLRNPTSCTPDGTGLPTTLHLDSWFNPGDFKNATFVSHKPPGFSQPGTPFPLNPLPPDQWGAPIGTTNCDRVPFDPSLTVTPGAIDSPAQAGKPSSFTFDLTLPQSELPDAVATSDLKKAVVRLPEGVRVSPSAADGLDACSPPEIALKSTAGPTCPNGSKVGALTIETPLLDDPLTGSIYLATPHANPSGSLVALYLVAKGPGVIVKLPGKVAMDPVSGQLTATFDNNPQLPFSRLHLEFDGGPRASLVLPSRCGIYTTHAVMTSWSGATVFANSSFTLSRDGKGAPCPSQGFAPAFEAGTVNPVAGASTPFVLSLTRSDADQELRSLSVDMPQGLVAKIKGVPLCPAAPAAAGTCGEESRVGSVTTAAGAGPNPFYLPGHAYLAGPYKGAPFSLSIVVPAVAGPFDLGTVVVRAAIVVDRHTAALHVVSDPFPTILDGFPLQVRVVRVAVDRRTFIRNPTSCAEKHVRAAVGSVTGTVAQVSSRFQVGNCNALALKPRMQLTVGAKGHTRAHSSTPLTATLTQTPGQTNLKSVGVTLPLLFNARLDVVNNACTRAAFEAGHCEAAKAGSAVAVTPLLPHALRGGAYFVKDPHAPIGSLPNLIVALRGQVDFDLVGTITIPGGTLLSTTFDSVPDVPITKFILRLRAGQHGPVGTVANLCTGSARRATAHLKFEAQNGKSTSTDQRLRIAGCRTHQHHRRGNR